MALGLLAEGIATDIGTARTIAGNPLSWPKESQGETGGIEIF